MKHLFPSRFLRLVFGFVYVCIILLLFYPSTSKSPDYYFPALGKKVNLITHDILRGRYNISDMVIPFQRKCNLEHRVFFPKKFINSFLWDYLTTECDVEARDYLYFLRPLSCESLWDYLNKEPFPGFERHQRIGCAIARGELKGLFEDGWVCEFFPFPTTKALVTEYGFSDGIVLYVFILVEDLRKQIHDESLLNLILKSQVFSDILLDYEELKRFERELDEKLPSQTK